MNISPCGPIVHLVASPARVYTDLAARFCRSPKSISEIVEAPYSKGLVENIIQSGHLAATEFDFWIFGVENVSRVLEVQLVRKRLASYLIASGRHEGARDYSVVLPKTVFDKKTEKIPTSYGDISVEEYLDLGEEIYDYLHEDGVPAEDCRYLKPQGTGTKILIGMNTHSLLDWFRIRCCTRAQWEIRTLAWSMLKLCKDNQPDVFKNAGPSCVVDGFCREKEGCGKAPSLDSLLHK